MRAVRGKIMLKTIDEYQKAVEITGFCNVSISDAKKISQNLQSKLPNNCEIQLFDADLVATWQHLYFATINALMAFKNGRNISKSLALETVLYASAQGQIQKALENIGVKPETKNVAILLICQKSESAKTGLEATAKLLGAQPDESVLELSPAKIKRIRKAFDITDAELEAKSANVGSEKVLVDLVVERVALLSTHT
jgi:tRNA threonylcarbamoyladenosine modification (KEOPS) complex Cgi121 subunit